MQVHYKAIDQALQRYEYAKVAKTLHSIELHLLLRCVALLLLQTSYVALQRRIPCKASINRTKKVKGDAPCKAPLCKDCAMQSGALQGMRHAKRSFARNAPCKAELCKECAFLQSEALYAKQSKAKQRTSFARKKESELCLHQRYNLYLYKNKTCK